MSGQESKQTRQVTGIPSKVPEGWYTVSKAAALVGRSADRLTEWRKTGVFIPTGWMQLGQTVVHLYSDEDIEEIKDLLRNYTPGSPLGEPE